jgi:hypothetical protein
VLADEDLEEDPDRWCSSTECGQELWQIACQWVWNLRLSLGQTMQAGSLREMEWAPPTETAPLFFAWEDTPEAYGPWQCAGESGRAAGRFTADAFTLQENGTLRCPAGASLNCALREQCLAPGAKGNRARRVSAVRRLLPPPASVERKPVLLGPMRWVDVAGRALRRTWTAHWRGQYVEVLVLAEIPKNVSPPPRPPRAVRSHHRWSWHDRLVCNAWSGPPQWRITPGFRSCFSRRKLTEGGSGKHRDAFNTVPSPSEWITRAEVICLLTAPLITLSLACNTRG